MAVVLRRLAPKATMTKLRPPRRRRMVARRKARTKKTTTTTLTLTLRRQVATPSQKTVMLRTTKTMSRKRKLG